MKKTLIYLATASLLFGCNNSAENNENAAKTLTEDQILDYLEKTIVDSTKIHNPNLTVDINKESGEKIIWTDSNTLFSERYIISLNTKKFIKGDLTGDDIEDILAPGADEVGASTHVPTFYLFKGVTNENYTTKYIKFNGYELAYCNKNTDGRGSFYAKSIQSNQLKGESICYDKPDPNCCPSMKFETLLRFDNKKNTFSLISQKPLK